MLIPRDAEYAASPLQMNAKLFYSFSSSMSLTPALDACNSSCPKSVGCSVSGC